MFLIRSMVLAKYFPEKKTKFSIMVLPYVLVQHACCIKFERVLVNRTRPDMVAHDPIELASV